MGRKSAFVSMLAVLGAAAPVAAAEAPLAGRVLPEVALPVAQGGSAPLVDRASAATALVFLRAGHERSLETIRMLAGCQARLAKEPVRLVGIVPADSAEGVALVVKAAGLALPLLVDADDEVYAAAGVRAHPAIAIADRTRRVVAFEPFHQVGYCDLVVARVQRAVGEIGDAELERVLAPASAQLPGDAPGAVAHRHVALARRLLEARSFGPAHESARKAIALAPSAETWRVEGEVFAAEGRCAEAVRAFDAALSLDPRDARASAGRQACGR